MIGQTISHYKILEKLGEGGMGVVFKAQDLKLNRPVALKFLPPQLAASEQDKQRFTHEARAASALDHPNICNVHEIDETPDGQVFIVMAIYEGIPLNKKIEKGPIKIEEALDVVIQAGEGLQAAHEKGIVHRDVKSSNIMMTDKGRAVIMDFGLARTSGATKLTKNGSTLGTVPYMSPEQARGEKVDHRTDIWSLGIVLYETITGRLPFRSEYNEALVYSILNEDPPPPTSLRSDVPMELERIVKKAMQKEWGARYQRVEEMLVDLRSVKKAMESGFSKTKPTATPSRKRDRLIVTAGLAAGFLIILIAGYLLLSIERTSTEKNSIAVLPFQNFGEASDDEYFSDGLTESIITDLAKIRGLLVIARNSVFQYKGKTVDIKKVGQELNVGYVLEGSLQRSANRFRINAQLIDVSTGYHLWADRYDRDMRDLFAVQDDISKNIVSALKITLKPDQSMPSSASLTQNLEAYDTYLRGMFYYQRPNQTDNEMAIQLFEKVVTLDPGFAQGHAYLARAYIKQLFTFEPKKVWEEKAQLELQKAISLDPNLAEAFYARGVLVWTPSNRFLHEQAIKEFTRALELNSNLAGAHLELGLVYNHIGLQSRALEELDRALRLDPNALVAASQRAMAYLYQHNYDDAIREFDRYPELSSTVRFVAYSKLPALSYLGRDREALALAEELLRREPDNEVAVGAYALALAHAGNHLRAEEQISRAIQVGRSFGHFHHVEYFIGCAYALMEKKALAIEWLEKAADEGLPTYPTYEKDPLLISLRDDPKFIAFMEKLRKQWEYYKATL